MEIITLPDVTCLHVEDVEKVTEKQHHHRPLPPRQLLILRLKCREEMSSADIAKMLRIKESAVRMSLKRSRDWMKRYGLWRDGMTLSQLGQALKGLVGRNE